MTSRWNESAHNDSADRQVAALSPYLIEALVDKARTAGGPVDGVNDLLNQLTTAVLERALAEEMTDHLG